MAINTNYQYQKQTESSTARTEGQLSTNQTTNGNGEDTVLSFQESMEAFKEKALDQIENGEPTYRIGGSEMSIKEWDKLMNKVDKDIDSIKEEQKKRLEKEEEERKAKELLESVDTKGTSESEVNESVIDKLFQENAIQ